MQDKHKTKRVTRRLLIIAVIVMSLILVAAGISIGGPLNPNGISASTTTTFSESDDVFTNPLMGYAPLASNSTAVGDNSLVFVLLSWRDWEPEKGQYDVAGLEQRFNLSRWEESGKRVVLRFVCDVPGSNAHIDIPDWLYEETGNDGMHYDISYGAGYAPDYTNSTFIERHKMAIEALGSSIGQDSFVAYIEIGSLGHWGEWHVNYEELLPRIPNEETCFEYIQPYIDAFPDAKLLMRRPFSWVSEYNFGMYNDMIGHSEATEEWLKWINEGGTYSDPVVSWELIQSPNSWTEAPIGGEFTSALSMETMLADDLETTLQLLAKSHVTFIGPKMPDTSTLESSAIDGASAVSKSIGYRFVISRSTVTTFLTGGVSVELDWENIGAAPMYWDWPVFLYVLSKDGATVHKQQVDLSLTSLLPGTTLQTETMIEPQNLIQDGGRIALGIEDPQTGEAAVTLAIVCETIDELHIIGSY